MQTHRPLPRPVVVCSLLLAVLATACGPTLKQSESFTPRRVNVMLFDDVCQLQPAFDQGAINFKVQSDSLVTGSGEMEVGTMTVRLAEGQATKVFLALLRKFYDGVPLKVGPETGVQAEVRYYRRARGARMIPIGATTKVEAAEQSVRLPYHPCLAAYFFGERLYKTRRQLVASSEL